MEETNN